MLKKIFLMQEIILLYTHWEFSHIVININMKDGNVTKEVDDMDKVIFTQSDEGANRYFPVAKSKI